METCRLRAWFGRVTIYDQPFGRGEVPYVGVCRRQSSGEKSALRGVVKSRSLYRDFFHITPRAAQLSTKSFVGRPAYGRAPSGFSEAPLEVGGRLPAGLAIREFKCIMMSMRLALLTFLKMAVLE